MAAPFLIAKNYASVRSFLRRLRMMAPTMPMAVPMLESASER